MKTNFLPLMVCLVAYVMPASAKNYYVSAAGSNSNNGLSSTAAWQTISKVNSSFASMSAGDSILFRRGDTFYGAIIVGKSGSSGKPIVISAYGTGAKPVISGFVNASSWSLVSAGIYQAYVPGAKSSLNMVTMNNMPQALGRYPNPADANNGYLNYETFTGYTAITDSQLTSSTNWAGAEVVIRKRLWVLDRCKITAHSGGTLTYSNTNGSTYTGTNGFGYFIQNDPRTLDQLGEWYFKTSNKYVQMYFGTALPSAYSVKVSTLDTLLTLSSKNYINVNNLVFEGANANAIYAASANYINIQNCDFINAGIGAINAQAVGNLLIENCTASNVLSNAIIINSLASSNVTIRGCSVKNTGNLPGMGLSNGNSYKGIVAAAKSNLLIEYNTVDTTGYVGIEFQGSNVNVQYNVVNYFDFIKDDAGGIYTYASGTDAAPGTIYTNRVVSNNIVMNGVGAPKGRSTATLYAAGIYLDGRSMNVTVQNNTVFNNSRQGIHSNNPSGVIIKGNTSYNNLNAISIMRWAWGSITNLNIKNNIFYPANSSQRCLYYTNVALNTPVATTAQAALTDLGNIDSNTYSMLNPVAFNSELYATEGGALVPTSSLSLDSWKSIASHDVNGKKTAKLPVGYTLNNIVGANKFSNGLFTSNISGLTIYGAGVTASWDNTGVIDGGSLRLNFSAPVANKYNLIYSAIGAVSSDKKYVLRFSTFGTSCQGIVRAYIRKTGTPYSALVASQTKSFGVGRTDHEFLFNAPITDAAASFIIEVEQNSGTTYIDNLAFYEATATVYDTASQLRFEYNATRLVKTILLDGKYTGVDGQQYSTSITLQPFTSIILVKDTTAAVTTARPSVSPAAKQNIAITVADTRALQVVAYPNPSTNSFNVKIESGSTEKVMLLVYSTEGRMLYQEKGDINSTYSFGNNFMPGMYLVKVIQGNNIQTVRLIKARR